MHMTRGHVCRTRAGTQYLASVAVIWTELIKLLVCVGAQAAECTRTAAQRGLGFREEAMHQAYEILGRSWPMLIPAGLFVMQQVCLASPRAGTVGVCLQPWWWCDRGSADPHTAEECTSQLISGLSS